MKPEPALSQHQIHHATFFPVTGIVTLADLRIIKGSTATRFDKDTVTIHGGTKALLLEKIEQIKKRSRLSKAYTVYIYTDKQFGMKKEHESIIYQLTAKQIFDAQKVN